MNIHTDAEPQPVKKGAVRTRGAVTGHNVPYVLGFGLAATIIAFIVIDSISVVFPTSVDDGLGRCPHETRGNHDYHRGLIAARRLLYCLPQRHVRGQDLSLQ